jgi:hypothetical protein
LYFPPVGSTAPGPSCSAFSSSFDSCPMRTQARLRSVFRDSSDGRSATRTDGRSDWPAVGLAQPPV